MFEIITVKPTCLCANQEVVNKNKKRCQSCSLLSPDAHGDSPKPCCESFFRFTSVISRSGEDTTLHLLCSVSIVGLQFKKKINTINGDIKIIGLF